MWTSRATSTSEHYVVPSPASAVRTRSAEMRSPFKFGCIEASLERGSSLVRLPYEMEHLTLIEQGRSEVDEKIRLFEQRHAVGGESLSFFSEALSGPDLRENAEGEGLGGEALGGRSDRGGSSAPMRSSWS